MRIAGLGYARIYGPNNTRALLLNRGRLTRHGQRILSPVGGGIMLRPEGRQYLDQLGATEFDGGDDELLCQVPDQHIKTAIEWFMRRQGRELTVGRELREELIGETSLLSTANLAGYTERFTGFYRHDGPSRRPVSNPFTAYVIDVFDVVLPEAAMDKLLLASQLSIERRWVYFVTPTEINEGLTKDGVTIGSISRSIL